MNAPLLSPGRHTVQVNGIRLSYEVRGQGPLLVWHPGGPGMAVQGYPGYDVIAQSFTVVYLDPRGVGHSDALVQLPVDFKVSNFEEMELPGSEAFRLENYSDDLVALADLWGIEKLTIAGHSHGGFVVFDLMTRYPNRVGKAIIAGSGPSFGEDEALQAKRKAKESSPAYQKYLALYQEEEKKGFTGDSWYQYGLMLQLTIDVHDFEKHESRLREHILGTSSANLAFAPAFYFGRYDAEQYDMRPRFGDITADVLFLQGRQELLFSPESIEDAVAKIPSAQVVWIDECAHMIQTEQPEAVLDALRAFIGQTNATVRAN